MSPGGENDGVISLREREARLCTARLGSALKHDPRRANIPWRSSALARAINRAASGLFCASAAACGDAAAIWATRLLAAVWSAMGGSAVRRARSRSSASVLSRSCCNERRNSAVALSAACLSCAASSEALADTAACVSISRRASLSSFASSRNRRLRALTERRVSASSFAKVSVRRRSCSNDCASSADASAAGLTSMHKLYSTCSRPKIVLLATGQSAQCPRVPAISFQFD